MMNQKGLAARLRANIRHIQATLKLMGAEEEPSAPSAVHAANWALTYSVILKDKSRPNDLEKIVQQFVDKGEVVKVEVKLLKGAINEHSDEVLPPGPSSPGLLPG